MKILKKIKQFFCSHDWDYLWAAFEEAIWSEKEHRIKTTKRIIIKCKKCGKYGYEEHKGL